MGSNSQVSDFLDSLGDILGDLKDYAIKAVYRDDYSNASAMSDVYESLGIHYSGTIVQYSGRIGADTKFATGGKYLDSDLDKVFNKEFLGTLSYGQLVQARAGLAQYNDWELRTLDFHVDGIAKANAVSAAIIAISGATPVTKPVAAIGGLMAVDAELAELKAALNKTVLGRNVFREAQVNDQIAEVYERSVLSLNDAGIPGGPFGVVRTDSSNIAFAVHATSPGGIVVDVPGIGPVTTMTPLEAQNRFRALNALAIEALTATGLYDLTTSNTNVIEQARTLTNYVREVADYQASAGHALDLRSAPTNSELGGVVDHVTQEDIERALNVANYGRGAGPLPEKKWGQSAIP